MTVPDPETLRAALPALRRFALTVRPQTATQPWHATLVADDLPGRPARPDAPAGGQACEFESPLELLRYLARITLLPPPNSGLR